MNKVFVCIAALAAALLVFGCTSSMLSEAEQQSLAAAATAAPKLQPGDKIRVNVFGEEKLSGDYEIDQSGQISLPLAGTVEALGLTQAELGKRWLRNSAASISEIQRSPLRLRRCGPFT